MTKIVSFQGMNRNNKYNAKEWCKMKYPKYYEFVEVHDNM